GTTHQSIIAGAGARPCRTPRTFQNSRPASRPARILERPRHMIVPVVDLNRIVEIPHADWAPQVSRDEARRLAGELELGKVLYFPRLAFAVAAGEGRFYDTRWLSGSHKSASYEPGR